MFRLSENHSLPFYPSVSSLKDDKRFLRRFYKKRIGHLTSFEKHQKQKQIVELLNKLSFWEEAHYVAFYCALKDEPCLSSFYQLWPHKACFPAINHSKLDFYINKGAWQKGRFAFKEPLKKIENKVSLSDISVVLVPGRAFDRRGGRLGRGYGYYDQTLALIREIYSVNNKTREGIKKTLFIGIGFTEQIHNESLPTLEHDLFMDILITDRFILKPVDLSVRFFKQKFKSARNKNKR